MTSSTGQSCPRRRTPDGSDQCRRALAALRRPLARDEAHAVFWTAHARNGVLLSEVAAVLVAGYTFVTDTPVRHDVVVVGLLLAVALASPALLVLPIARMVQGPSGSWLFYLWSVADTAVIAIGAVRDGGGSSPLSALLFLTLAYMAMAYPPVAVAMIGALMTTTYAFVICAARLDLSGGFLAMTMVLFTAICTLTAHNLWRAHDEQAMNLRTQELLAATDPLTGLLNRRALLERLRAPAAPDGTVRVLCVVDLDGFKQVNDTMGHAVGDEVLRCVGQALEQSVRETDTVARTGGDEFAVIVRSAIPADQMAERLRSAVAQVGATWGVTASVGVVALRPEVAADAALARADHAMYAAKAGGGNRIVEASSSGGAGGTPG